MTKHTTDDQAHRHGRKEPYAAEQARKLQEAIEATHDAVFGAAPCSPSSVDLLSYIDFIAPKFASAMGMSQYEDAAMDELLQWLLEWRSQSHQWSDELLGRVSQGQIETRRYNGP